MKGPSLLTYVINLQMSSLHKDGYPFLLPDMRYATTLEHQEIHPISELFPIPPLSFRLLENTVDVAGNIK